ncbi:MAG: hypothetical protein H6934_08060 [Burkholderiaceae bacterium]|nr:hypothetical protein [Burkholderiaceae bacterium]
MSIATEYLGLLERLGPAAMPAVRGFHLPPRPLWGTKDGEFGALELDDGSIGLSYVLLGDTLTRLLQEGSGALVGRSVLDVARWYEAFDGPRQTIGFAAINAASQHLFRLAGYRPPDASDSIGGIDPRPGDSIGMVGLFPPLVRRIVAAGARLVVIELRQELAGEHDGYRVSLDPSELERCDKVVSTTTLLLNRTLEQVLGHCTNARVLSLIGPGGGCLPDPLFARGVTSLGGTEVTDTHAFLGAMRSGSAWGAYARKYAITRSEYPGFAALVGRLHRTSP